MGEYDEQEVVAQELHQSAHTDDQRKRPADNNSQYNNNKRRNTGPRKPTIKFLVPNLAVGKLIGKGGSNIAELEKNFNAQIEVSPSRDFFPGTNLRSVAVSAEIDQLIELSKRLVQDIQDDGGSGGNGGHGQDFVVVITNSAIGFIMGKGGSVIKVIQEESGASINIQKQSESPSPGERVVTVSGSVEQMSKAVADIISKVSVEPHRMSNPMTKYGAGAGGGGAGGGGGDGGYQQQQPNYRDNYQDNYAPRPTRTADFRGGFNLSTNLAGGDGHYSDPYAQIDKPHAGGYGAAPQSAPQRNNFNNSRYDDAAPPPPRSYDNADFHEPRSSVKTSHFITMEIPNVWVGSIVGKQGVTINEFSRNSGAQISFSGKEEFAPGTQDRILTIKGGKSQVSRAYMMIDNKVAEVEQEFGTGAGAGGRRY